jgi:tetratricopeptide (TPR) repeat protein
MALGGRFETDGERLMVAVELVEGATGLISWSDGFEGSFADVFQIQTWIAQGVAANLGQRLTPDVATILARAESSSESAYDFYLQGADHLQEGNHEAVGIAFNFFTQAITVDPRLAEAHVGLGAVYLERFWNGWGGGTGNLTLATASFRQALLLDPASVRAQRGLNLAAWYRGRGDAHLAFARDAARQGKDDIETLLARAEVFTTDGPEDLAEPILDRVIAFDPANQSAAWHFITVYFNTRRFAHAAHAADDYIRRFGHEPFIYQFAAGAHEQLGDLAAAEDRFERATRPLMQFSMEPGIATADELIALLKAGAFHARHGQPVRARALWQRGVRLTKNALALDPESVGLHLYLASFHAVLGDRAALEREEATARMLAEAADLNPWELRHLAEAHALAGNPRRAIEILQNALRGGRFFARTAMTAVTPSLEQADGFDQLVREYDAAEDERRRLYGPGS